MSAVKDTLSSLTRRFRTWREQHRAYAELSALDDHSLADLGLRRSDIPFVVFCKAKESAQSTERLAANSNTKRHVAA